MSSGLDIQQFVGRVDVLRASLWPLLWVHPIVSDLVHWVSPLRSSLTLVCLCAACLFAEHWIPVAFLTLSLMLVFGFVKSKASEASSDNAHARSDRPRYRDNTTQFLALCHEDVVKTEESIRKFRCLVEQLQAGVLQAFHVTEEMRGVLYWRQPVRTAKYLIGSVLISITYWLVSWRLVLVVVIVWSFMVNGCLYEMIHERMKRFKRVKKRLSTPIITITDTVKETVDPVSNGELSVKQVEAANSSNDDNDDEIDIQSLNRFALDDSTDSGDTGPTRSLQESINTDVTVDSEVVKSSALSRFLRRRTTANARVVSKRRKPVKPRCFSCNKSLRSSHVFCSSCGDKFCGNCCGNQVLRSQLGATSPAAYQEKVFVCGRCYFRLLKK
ncbi:protrudin-like [Corticium candelabrum]|uniref:protrudin-like n=1 Tax=Corticium candelabrum TaxID=121492 RepID=UPI002E25C58C|nr:protrudin-like [Corticium candelabrum]